MDLVVWDWNYSGWKMNYHGRVFVCERRLDMMIYIGVSWNPNEWGDALIRYCHG